MKNKFTDWLKIRTKQERKQYISELKRHATKEDYKFWGIYSCMLIGYSVSVVNLIAIIKYLIFGNYISWLVIVITQIFALVLLWLHRYLTRQTGK